MSMICRWAILIILSSLAPQVMADHSLSPPLRELWACPSDTQVYISVSILSGYANSCSDTWSDADYYAVIYLGSTSARTDGSCTNCGDTFSINSGWINLGCQESSISALQIDLKDEDSWAEGDDDFCFSLFDYDWTTSGTTTLYSGSQYLSYEKSIIYPPSPAPTPYPTPQPTPEPTVEPTSQPTRVPNPAPTRFPIPSPTSLPIPAPTKLPTAKPTLVPTSSPSPAPSLSPSTSRPSLLPSPPPSPNPSSVPSLPPTPSPTSLPTVSCEAGYYLPLGTWQCQPCMPGKFSNHTPFPPYPKNCTSCPAGKYNPLYGAKECISCMIGRLSSEDRVECKQCVAGEFAKEFVECVPCHFGKFAPQPMSDDCWACPAGSHTNKISAATQCSPCTAGQYSSGSANGLNCSVCVSGTFSLGGAPYCTKCSLGRIAPHAESTQCLSCAAGSFINHTGGSECTLCMPGKFQSATGQEQCFECSLGTYSSRAGAITCSECSAGTYRDGTESELGRHCLSCPIGQAQPRTGQSECEDCISAKYAPSLGSVSCLTCSSAKTSRASSGVCDLAKEGYYLNFIAFSSSGGGDDAEEKSIDMNDVAALPCPLNAYCEGSQLMPRPLKGFWVDRTAIDFASIIYRCHQATCIGASSTSIALNTAPPTRERRRLLGDNTTSCWSASRYYSSPPDALAADDDGNDPSTYCSSDHLMCLEGSGGYLCGHCLDGYTFNNAKGKCVICGGGDHLFPIVLFCAVFLLSIIVALLMLVPVIRRRVRKLAICIICTQLVRTTPPFNLIKYCDSGMIKVLWSSFQILATISWNLSVEFPQPFSSLLYLLSFLQLDFLSLDCARGKSSFFARALLTSLGPIFIAILNLLVYTVRLIALYCRHRRRIILRHRLTQHPSQDWQLKTHTTATDGVSDDLSLSTTTIPAEWNERAERATALAPPFGRETSTTDSLSDALSLASIDQDDLSTVKERKTALGTQHATLFLLLTYVTLPPCAMVQFAALNCESLEHGSISFLRSDSGVDCNSRTFKRFTVVNLCFVCCYQSIPLLWLVLLWRQRHKLNPDQARRTKFRKEDAYHRDDDNCEDDGDDCDDNSLNSDDPGVELGAKAEQNTIMRDAIVRSSPQGIAVGSNDSVKYGQTSKRSGGFGFGDRSTSAAVLSTSDPSGGGNGSFVLGDLSEEGQPFDAPRRDPRDQANDPAIAYLRFLWIDYRPSMFAFEVLVIYCRVLLVSVLPLLGRAGDQRAGVGCFITIIFIAFAREAQPFRRQSTNILLIVALYQILLTFLGALLILSDSLSAFGLKNDVALGSVLLLVNMVIVLLTCYWLVCRFRIDQERRSWRGAQLSPSQLRLLDAVMRGTNIGADLDDHGSLNNDDIEEQTKEQTTPIRLFGGKENAADVESKRPITRRGSAMTLDFSRKGTSLAAGTNNGNRQVTGEALIAEGNTRVKRSNTLLKGAKTDLRQFLAMKQYYVAHKDVKLVRRVGAGSFGEVFLGSLRGQPVAVKTLLEVNQTTVRAFRHEILITASLHHPNIINFMGATWGRDLSALILEWVPKGALEDLLRQRSEEYGTISSNESTTRSRDASRSISSEKGRAQGVGTFNWQEPLLGLATDIARGMAYLHAMQLYDQVDDRVKSCVIHRDLKPDNVLITDFTRAKISDFGTSRAKLIQENITMTAVGTPLFAAPEVMNGEQYDEKCDCFSMGMLLLAMAIDEPLLNFIGEQFRISFHKKKVPKSPLRLIRAINSGWRPFPEHLVDGYHSDESSNCGRSDRRDSRLEHGSKDDSSATSVEADRASGRSQEKKSDWTGRKESSSLHGVPPALRRLIASCCAQNPSHRPSFAQILNELTVGDVAKEIERAEIPLLRQRPSQRVRSSSKPTQKLAPAAIQELSNKGLKTTGEKSEKTFPKEARLSYSLFSKNFPPKRNGERAVEQGDVEMQINPLSTLSRDVRVRSLGIVRETASELSSDVDSGGSKRTGEQSTDWTVL